MRKFRFPVAVLLAFSVFVSAGCVGVVAVEHPVVVRERPGHAVVVVEERPVVVVHPRPVVVVRPHHRHHH
jgi:hypothetical protein